MRQKRAKQYRKQMNVYLHSFKFREPFQTIVDAELVLHATKASFDLVKGLNRTIQAEVKPMITQCCMQELYFSKDQRAIDLAKKFERRRCNHPPSKPIPAGECIKSIVDVNGENKHRYIVLTQDELLRRHLRRVPGVPLVYMNRSVMVMEPLSKASAKVQEYVETRKLTGGLNDYKLAGLQEQEKKLELKVEGEGEVYTSEEPLKKKRKGPKGPNPLSVKKKLKKEDQEPSKKQDGEEGQDAFQKKKRRRRHHGSSGDKEDENGEQGEEENNHSEEEST